MKSISFDLPHIDNYSLWLTFDEESTARCQNIIQRLAQTYQSVSFTPHVTLSGAPDWTEKKLKTAIDDIIKEVPPLELRTSSVRCSSNPYQKLTHGIMVSDQLSTLHQKVNVGFNGDYGNKAYPHISYLYSRLDCRDIIHEIEEVEKEAPGKVLANQLVLVRCKGTPENWRMLFSWELTN